MYTYDSIHEPKQFRYDVAQRITEHVIEYTFISKGERNILKVINYTFLEEWNGRKLFNFGFGDYNLENGAIVDNVISNNGDAYKVFNTVLTTVPRFFEIHNNAIMVVEGSDSGPEFVDTCRANCRKCCADVCKNANRRINIYRGYVNKHYDALKTDYTFYGGLDRTNNKLSMIAYEAGDQHESIVLIKNKNQDYMTDEKNQTKKLIKQASAEKNQTQELMEPTSAEEMMALFMERRKNSNVDLFAASNERVRKKLKEGRL